MARKSKSVRMMIVVGVVVGIILILAAVIIFSTRGSGVALGTDGEYPEGFAGTLSWTDEVDGDEIEAKMTVWTPTAYTKAFLHPYRTDKVIKVGEENAYVIPFVLKLTNSKSRGDVELVGRVGPGNGKGTRTGWNYASHGAVINIDALFYTACFTEGWSIQKSSQGKDAYERHTEGYLDFDCVIPEGKTVAICGYTVFVDELAAQIPGGVGNTFFGAPIDTWSEPSKTLFGVSLYAEEGYWYDDDKNIMKWVMFSIEKDDLGDLVLKEY